MKFLHTAIWVVETWLNLAVVLILWAMLLLIVRPCQLLSSAVQNQTITELSQTVLSAACNMTPQASCFDLHRA